MKKLKQVALGQRYQIAILLKAGLNQTQIAKQLEVHKSTSAGNCVAIAANEVIVRSRLRDWQTRGASSRGNASPDKPGSGQSSC